MDQWVVLIWRISLLPINTKFRLLAPIIIAKKGSFVNELTHLKQQGVEKVRIDGKFININEKIPELNINELHTIEIIIDRIIMKQNMETRIHNAVEKCLKNSSGIVILNVVEFPNEQESYSLNSQRTIYAGEYEVFSTQYCCPDCNLYSRN